MKAKMRRGARRWKRVYKEPWTVRSAWINVVVWGAMTGWTFGLIAWGLLNDERLRWVWLTFQAAMLFVQFTVVKWSVDGLRWRTRQDLLRKEEEKFLEMMEEAYGSGSRD
jgi:hypothetical protein